MRLSKINSNYNYKNNQAPAFKGAKEQVLFIDTVRLGLAKVVREENSSALQSYFNNALEVLKERLSTEQGFFNFRSFSRGFSCEKDSTITLPINWKCRGGRITKRSFYVTDTPPPTESISISDLGENKIGLSYHDTRKSSAGNAIQTIIKIFLNTDGKICKETITLTETSKKIHETTTTDIFEIETEAFKEDKESKRKFLNKI